jgi:hypothetical protein
MGGSTAAESESTPLLSLAHGHAQNAPICTVLALIGFESRSAPNGG